MNCLRKFLIFCPDISGHRHLYCRRMATYLLSRGAHVCIATAGRPDDCDGWGRQRYKSFNNDATEQLFQLEGVEFLDLKNLSGGRIGSLAQLRSVAAATGATDVVHLDADIYRFPLAFGYGKSDGLTHHLVVICTEFIDWSQKISSKSEFKILVTSLFSRNLRAQLLGERQFTVMRAPRISAWLVKRMLRRKDVGSLITTDERLSPVLGEKAWCITELGTSHWESEYGVMDDFSAHVLKTVHEFRDKHNDKEVICLLGDLENRKGYELLLQLCARDASTVCIRIGRTKTDYHTTWTAIETKEQLMRENRILEIDSYVASWEVFRTVHRMQSISVLPYRRFYRTSGSFVDSIVSGLPIVVPSQGLMGHRVKEGGLGITFVDGDIDSLCEAYQRCRENLEFHRKNVSNYSATVEKSHLYKIFDAAFGFQSQPGLQSP